MTNVFVIAPTDNTATDVVQPATPFWDLGDPVTLMVDLGQAAIVLPVSVRECFSGMGYGWLSKQ